MLETSNDLLNIVIAFCVLWFTIFLCWMIYYVAMILKRVHHVMEALNNTLGAIEGFFTDAKEKIKNVSSTMSTAVEVGKRVAEFVQDKAEKHKTKKEVRRTKKNQKKTDIE